jgi:hypothetical protein
MFGITRRRGDRQKLNQAASAAEGAADILGAGGIVDVTSLQAYKQTC